LRRDSQFLECRIPLLAKFSFVANVLLDYTCQLNTQVQIIWKISNSELTRTYLIDAMSIFQRRFKATKQVTETKEVGFEAEKT
jgi:hypothetical protein